MLISMLYAFLISYIKIVLLITILFAMFNALRQQHISKEVLKFTKGEKFTIGLAPIAYILIYLIFGSGFFSAIIGIIAFTCIYTYFVKKYPY